MQLLAKLWCCACLLQVGHDAAEVTGGTMSTTELSGHTDSVVSVAFNAAGATDFSSQG